MDIFKVGDCMRSLIENEPFVSDILSRLPLNKLSRSVLRKSNRYSKANRLKVRAQRPSKVVKSLAMAKARMSL